MYQYWVEKKSQTNEESLYMYKVLYLSLVLSRRTFTSNSKPSKVIIWGMLFFTTGTSKLLPNSSGLTLIMMELSS